MKDSRKPGNYLNFTKFLTPVLVQVVFWILTIANVITSISGISRNGFVLFILQIVLGTIAIRLICETTIIFFKIYEVMVQIQSNQKKSLVRNAPQGTASLSSERPARQPSSNPQPNNRMGTKKFNPNATPQRADGKPIDFRPRPGIKRED